MQPVDTSDYHLSELRIAQEPSDPGHILPPIPEGCRAVLDIGCGAGQTLIASRLAPGVLACGVDPDLSALRLGRTVTDRVRFAAALGETLPFAGETFDLVFSRVALPYTNIPRALEEIERVLKPGGEVWFTLHSPAFALRVLGGGLRDRSLRRLLYSFYLMANGLLLQFLGRQVAWPFGRRRYESVQTDRGMKRALKRAGLSEPRVSRGRFYVVTAQKRPR